MPLLAREQIPRTKNRASERQYNIWGKLTVVTPYAARRGMRAPGTVIGFGGIFPPAIPK